MKYRGIIFDFNGVLLLDRDWHEEAWNMVSNQLRGQPFSLEESEQYIHGRTPKETFLYLLPDASETELEKLNLLKEQKYQEVTLSQGDRFMLAPSAERLFELLKQQGIKFTIATSSPLINLEFYFEHLGLHKWFNIEQVVYDDGSYRGKPAPDMFLEAARRLGVDIQRCIIVEDSWSGIEAAKNADAGKIIMVSKNLATTKPESVAKVVSDLSQINLEDFQE